MANKNYQRGRRLEWQVKKDLEASGYHVTRASGSHSAYDLIAVAEIGNSLYLRFIQCKTTKNLTAAKVNKLREELKKTSPILRGRAAEDGYGAPVFIHVDLIIKEHGNSEYETYPLES